MKKLFLLLLLTLSTTFTASYSEVTPPLKSTRLEGEPFFADGIAWQRVVIEKPYFQITALLPGQIHLQPGIAMSKAVLNERAPDGSSLFVIDARNHAIAPNNYEALVEEYTKWKGDGKLNGQFRPLECKNPLVKFAAEYKGRNEKSFDETSRIFVTPYRVYLLMVAGNNEGLTATFFDSFSILKDEINEN